MKPFCEIIVKSTLPAIRARLALKLSEKGLSGKEIAKRMGLTPAAVTQYLHKARGSNSIQNELVEEQINSFADELMQKKLDEKEKIKRFCELCKTVRAQGLICEMHRESAGLGECSLCH
ncbi:transcriptional regulator [archaeon]|nr:transcriptional regulator [archaeon]